MGAVPVTLGALGFIVLRTRQGLATRHRSRPFCDQNCLTKRTSAVLRW